MFDERENLVRIYEHRERGVLEKKTVQKIVPSSIWPLAGASFDFHLDFINSSNFLLDNSNLAFGER